MKHPLAWHRNCLQNMLQTLEGRRTELSHVREAVERLNTETVIYAHQIERAEREGRDSFDREKFNHKKARR